MLGEVLPAMNTKISLPVLVATCTLCGCVSEPFEVPVAQRPELPDTNVYFYPSQGRSIPAAQQDRDKYECNTWAVEQSNFDPSAPEVPPHQRMQIVDQSPPNGAVVGGAAVTGAALGAVVNPSHAGSGALIGGLAGAAVGGIVAAEHDEQLNRLKAHADLSEAQTAVMETKAAEFRRAIGACLEGRGYSVR
jgi:hypothetical protein